MDYRIIDKVLTTSKRLSIVMPEETGIWSSLSDEEIKEYIEQVLVETQKKKPRNGNP
jgi:hypothetical protein